MSGLMARLKALERRSAAHPAAEERDDSAPGAAEPIPIRGPGEEPRLEKLRELLFGDPFRQVENRLLDLEERVRREIRQEVATVECQATGALEALSRHVQAEHRKRVEADAEADEGLKQLASRLAQALADLAQKQQEAQGSLEQQAQRRIRTLAGDLRARQRELSKQVRQGLAELETHKTERDNLSALLVEIASRLDAGSSQGGGERSSQTGPARSGSRRSPSK